MRGLGIATAAVLDALVGEPAGTLHPVRWMGSYLGAARRWNRTYGGSGWRGRSAGIAWTACGAALAAAAGARVNRRLERGGVQEELLAGALLFPMFSLRGLVRAAAGVRHALEEGDLGTARSRLGRDLVSRPTADLSAPEVAGAAIESLAENLSDSVVAPLAYAAGGGLGAVYAYRFVNTADAMLGYKTSELGDFGWGAARFDDVLNGVPARITAGLLVTLAPTVGGAAADALALARRDGGSTESPNAGWPMAAMAGALDVRLTKRNAHSLNDGARDPSISDLRNAELLVSRAGYLAAAVAVILAEVS